jgi:hypothetical protein
MGPPSGYSGEALKLTYGKIKELFNDVDSYDVVKEVDRYRNYWKPHKVSVVLLAESHVFTSDEDSRIEMNYSRFEKLNSGYPRKFVRFVYCLGYSEPRLFANKPSNPSFKNPGTWQFWKIFCACASESEKIKCNAVLKGTTRNLIDRINNKIDLLNKLRVKGIWLVDSSIVGINKLPRNQRERIVLMSWNNYAEHLVGEARPKTIIVIGKTVLDVLESKIKRMNIPYYSVSQPQAHLTSEERVREHEELRRLCSKYCAKSSY